MKFDLSKLLAKEAKSLFRSTARSKAKSTISNLAKKFFSKSEEDIKNEVIEKLGYLSAHYKVKNDEPIFKGSSLFFHEFITNNPELCNKLIKDEETGKLFFNEKPITNNDKTKIIKFICDKTKITTSAPSYFKTACDLLEVKDVNSIVFENEFSGWNEKNESVIDSWLENCFGNGVLSDIKFSNILFKKWVVGTAARAMAPGSSLDGCLTLVGPPGVGKTRFFRNMLPEPFDSRTGEIYCSIKNPRQFTESIIGKTIACFDELSQLSDSKMEDVFKQLITSENIDVRLAYRRDPQRYELRQGFAATSNSEKCIPNETFSRRLWIIKLGQERLNFEFVNKNNKKLWQEACYYAKQGFRTYLNREEQEHLEKINKNHLK